MEKIWICLIFIVLTLRADGVYISVNGLFIEHTPSKKTINYKNIINLKGLSLALGIRAVSFDITNDVNKQLLSEKALDDNSISYEIGLSYNLNPNVFTSLIFQTSTLDSATINNTYLSINYIKHYSNYVNPYVGAIIGLSYLTWDKEPVKNSINKIENDTKFIYGVQLGNEFVFTNYLNLYINYQYLELDHTAFINNDDSIKHNYQTSSSLGVKYDF